LGTFFIALTTIAIAEIGDRTQLLSLALAARYGRPWPIIAGILLATIANHTAAGVVGAWFGTLLTPMVLDAAVGISMVAMALWVLRADTLAAGPDANRRGAFVATLVSFFIVEIGDKTQIATLSLAAAYTNLAGVIVGTTAGMLVANIPAVFLGDALGGRLPLKAMNYVAAGLFGALGAYFVTRAVVPWWF
jgi:putative Ca2+/H+ antiporter (TMEM165/GDT1 family)